MERCLFARVGKRGLAHLTYQIIRKDVFVRLPDCRQAGRPNKESPNFPGQEYFWLINHTYDKARNVSRII